MKPTGKRVLLQRLAPEAPKSSSIIIPDTAIAPSQQFRVIAIGPKVEDIAVGETVLMGRYAGAEVEIQGRTFLIVEMEEILAIVS